MTRQKGPSGLGMEAAAAAGAGRPGLPGTARGWGKGAVLPGTRGGRPQRSRTAWARTRSRLSLFTPGTPAESGRGQLNPRPQVPRQFPGVLHLSSRRPISACHRQGSEETSLPRLTERMHCGAGCDAKSPRFPEVAVATRQPWIRTRRMGPKQEN